MPFLKNAAQTLAASNKEVTAHGQWRDGSNDAKEGVDDFSEKRSANFSGE